MEVVCAWCGKKLGEKDGQGVEGVSHGMCQDCHDKWRGGKSTPSVGGETHRMKPEDCPKLDECYKVKMILDKDLLEPQYAKAIRAVCAKCWRKKETAKAIQSA